MNPTEVFETYWRFAMERQNVYFGRLQNPFGEWTQDLILQQYRFTNAFRAADRVSQYLIKEVQYAEHRPQMPEEVFFRTLLFKLFNKVETWEILESQCGPLEFNRIDFNFLSTVLGKIAASGQAVYSAAYIMPAPKLGHKRKYDNHLALLSMMMEDRLPLKLGQQPSLEAVYTTLRSYPGIGAFLAFQFAIDLNYSALLDFPESSFVVAGPGAIDGISKCFSDIKSYKPEEIIFATYEMQDDAFASRDLSFRNLFGRKLMPIDCQNLYCEISKYARVAHPEFQGSSHRTRIKQRYKINHTPLPDPVFPPKWGLDKNVATVMQNIA